MRSGYFRLQFLMKVETQFDAAILDKEFALIPKRIWAHQLKRWRKPVSYGIPCIITCKRGSATVVLAVVVQDHLLFLWRTSNFEPLQSRNYCTNQYQILNDWLPRWDKENCQIWLQWVLGKRLLKWVKYTLLCKKIVGSLIRLQTTIHNGFWCTMAHKIRFGARMCLLSIQSVKI